MFASDLEKLIKEHEGNVKKFYKEYHGVDISESKPKDLLEQLNGMLTDSVSSGVSYDDVQLLRNIPEIRPITYRLDPNNYDHNKSFYGVKLYQDTIKAAISILNTK